jgi:flagellar biosynthetic protein FliO
MNDLWMSYIIKLLFIFGLILIFMKYFLPKLIKQQVNKDQSIRVLSCKSLGNNKNLLLVTVRQKELLLGVTDTHIEILTEFTATLDLASLDDMKPKVKLED